MGKRVLEVYRGGRLFDLMILTSKLALQLSSSAGWTAPLRQMIKPTSVPIWKCPCACVSKIDSCPTDSVHLNALNAIYSCESTLAHIQHMHQ